MNSSQHARRPSLARHWVVAALLLLTFAAVIRAAGEELIPSFDLNWFTIDHGGGISAAGGYDLHGSIGQLDASPNLTGGAPGAVYSMSPGYWPGVEPQPLCPADISPSITGDGIVNIQDLLAVVAAWGQSGPPGTIPADVNDDGVVNILDLLAVVAAWGACPI